MVESSRRNGLPLCTSSRVIAAESGGELCCLRRSLLCSQRRILLEVKHGDGLSICICKQNNNVGTVELSAEGYVGSWCNCIACSKISSKSWHWSEGVLFVFDASLRTKMRRWTFFPQRALASATDWLYFACCTSVFLGDRYQIDFHTCKVWSSITICIPNYLCSFVSFDSDVTAVGSNAKV